MTPHPTTRTEPPAEGRIEGPRAAAQALLARLEAPPLSGGEGALAFAERLADEQGWTLGHARAVTHEYRRFLVLTQLAGHPVCPSEDVDQAWHLHIAQTRAYERLCGEVFGRFLHHDPSLGGPAELQRHRAMYADTLAAYARCFGIEPPAATWPAVDDRFAPPQAVPGPSGFRLPGALPRGARLASLAIVLPLLAGAVLSRTGVFDGWHQVSGPMFLAYEAALLVVLALLAVVWRDASAPRSPGEGRDALDAYEVAWLAGGEGRLAATAIATLIDRGLLAARPDTSGAKRDSTAPLPLTVMRPPAELAGALHPVEAAALASADDGRTDYLAVRRAMHVPAARIAARLRRAGLAQSPHWMPAARALLAAVACLGLAVVVERLLHAIDVGRPHGFLVPLLVAHVVLVIALCIAPARPSGAARQRLADLKRQAQALQRRAKRRPAEPGLPGRGVEANDATWLLLGVALIGAPAFAADPRYAGMERALGREGMVASNGGDGGSAGIGGDGGSGCGGGGCGGGGCGG